MAPNASAVKNTLVSSRHGTAHVVLDVVVAPLPGRDLRYVPAPLREGPDVAHHQPAADRFQVDDGEAHLPGLAGVDQRGSRSGVATRNQPATLNISRPTGRDAGSALEAAADGRNPGCDSIPP